ncbi:MAG: (d)CMP kinase [Spirochaetales bacterium]|nr:(d)CMP kinase [Spirochaetales bacterium]
MSNKITIAISGKSGCGNTSVSKIVADTLGLRLINFTFRDMAKEWGIDFEEMCELAEKDPQYDRYLDNMLIMLASKGDCVLGSRLAIWHLKNADLKAYLMSSIEVRAARIAKREKIPYETSIARTIERDRRDHARYLRQYGIDIDGYDFADCIIDTEKGDQYYVAGLIIDRAKGIISDETGR